MQTSRERFLAQLERCARYQDETITLPDPPRASENIMESAVFLPPEVTGNGEELHCDANAVWGLRPPNEVTPPMNSIGDWA